MDYKIKFSDQYYQAWVPGVLEGTAPHQISGRLILWQDTLGNIYSIRAIFDDYAVKQIISNLPCEFEDFSPFTYELKRDGHIAELDEQVFFTTGYHFPPLQGNFIHLTLDQEWYALLYGGNSNKVLRTLATGQSDITRHEAYTKATGLNEYNGLVPTYINKEQTLNQMLQIVKRSVPEATQIVLYYPNSLYNASNIYNIRQAYLAVAFPNNYIRQIVSNIVSPEDASIANFDIIPVTHSINSESQYTEVRDFEYVIPTKYTENSGVTSSTGSAYNSYAVVSEEDLIALQDLLNDLSNTNMDLYFGTTGK